MTAAVPVSTEPRARSAPRFPLTGSATRQGCGARQWKTWSRFIPACAGNTLKIAKNRRTQTVHPRVCGEHACSVAMTAKCRGSSPRVRGTRAADHRSRRERRFIPACAGNTAPRPAAQISAAVHPRVCGEHNILSVRVRPDDGSSPRVRGTPRGESPRPPQRRFIPACAGNTTQINLSMEDHAVHPRVCGEH